MTLAALPPSDVDRWESLSYAERRKIILSVACPRTGCRAQIGEPCRSPNGWGARHLVREHLARGQSVPAPKLGPLTEAQAQRIEVAAEAGSVWAPHRADFRGDRAQITVVEKLADKGLLVLVSQDDMERHYALTVAGWRVYREHRLIIRRLTDDEIDTGEATAVA